MKFHLQRFTISNKHLNTRVGSGSTRTYFMEAVRKATSGGEMAGPLAACLCLIS
jgi:hypothetical protein